MTAPKDGKGNPLDHAERARILSVIAECLARLPDRLEVACELPPAASAALRDLIDRERAALVIE